MRPLRIGLVGCGRLAELGYVPAVARSSMVTIAAVADPDPGRRARVGAVAFDHGMAVAAHADAATLLDRSEIDAVVLASPAAHHVDDAALAVARDLPVLVEKPPAPDAAGAAALADLGPGVRIGFNRRYDPDARLVRSTVPSRGPVDLDLQLHYRRASWGAHRVRDEVVLDLVPHLVDWSRWLTGAEITEVTSADLSPDRATLTLTHSRGVARLSAAADRLHREAIEVRDGHGEIVARHRTGGIVGAVTGRLRAGPHVLVTSLAEQLEAFARVAAGGTDDDLGTAADGLAAMQVIDAARASAASGEPITLPRPQERISC